MGCGNRRRIEPVDDWELLLLLAWWPKQRNYEELRPVTLFGASLAKMARETGTPEAYRRVLRTSGDEVEAVRRVIRTGRGKVGVPDLCFSHGWQEYLARVSHLIHGWCLYAESKQPEEESWPAVPESRRQR
jgi:hypothetical protein